MLILSILRIPVVAAIITSALLGGVYSGMDFHEALASFNEGIGGGASTALSYALLGAFAAAIAKSGLPEALAQKAFKKGVDKRGKWIIYIILGTAAIMSQNLVPIHIAFIPLLVPPLLSVANELNIDRRALACILSFGLVTTYMVLPVGFGGIYLNEILLANITRAGVDVSSVSTFDAMKIPALGMFLGLFIAVFISYRRPRYYTMPKQKVATEAVKISPRNTIFGLISVVIAFVVQLSADSMVLGALVGFALFSASGAIKWSETDSTFVEGMRMMANIGFIMISASGFAHVIQDSGQVNTLVQSASAFIHHNAALGALLMLAVGLFITMGIGSSFSTVPIIAAIFVPLASELGFSPLAIVTLVGTAGALGDTGSPASDSTLGPTSGLNIDGQHDHIKDTVIPTFLHYNIPLLIFGWIGAMLVK